MSVSTEKTLDRLKTFNDSPATILSVYFQLPNSNKYINKKIIDDFHKDLKSHLTTAQQKNLDNNIQMILGFMQTYKHTPVDKTLAIFTGGNNLFEVMHLPYKINTEISLSHSPNITPLLEQQEDTRRYLVILSDKEKAIFYTLYKGALEDKDEVYDDSVPSDINHIGSQGLRTQRDDKTQRRIHDHLQKHFQYIGKRAESFIKDKPFAGVILGGHKNEMSQFKEYLPKQLKDKVVGDFVSELQVNFNEILERSKTVINHVNKQLNTQVATS